MGWMSVYKIFYPVHFWKKMEEHIHEILQEWFIRTYKYCAFYSTGKQKSFSFLGQTGWGFMKTEGDGLQESFLEEFFSLLLPLPQ